jgi:FKBP-type peptidyl-prolyl cis-trans isomerase FkpA
MSEVTAVPIRPIARGSMVKLWLGLFLLCLAGAALAWVGTASQQVVELDHGVRMRVISEGHGPVMTDADVMLVTYRLHVGDLSAPVLQDSETLGQGQPFPATTSQVYPGFADGLRHMRAGGRYILWLPPGTGVTGPVPPNAGFSEHDTLVFELHTIQLGAGMAQELQQQQMMQMQQQMQEQMQQQGHGGGASGHGAAGAGHGGAEGGDAGAAGGSGGASGDAAPGNSASHRSR